ncbi:manganese transport protein [Diaminobutyricimonas aerilata]|uniref:Manganese transport protein n=1 Tax=Diaminobutyricimonas aerilata TaxID=1162967 RepID=A0A2M9CIB7_9MICO|nr:Nramp family divalent metal transporter [Diaminobutyricimonas aerilata]PJJ71663.1 manganese transport protein [Diaminobutyricimonas aerilata]
MSAAPPAAPRAALRVLPLLGPAMVAGVAYLDPGNVASNMTAGAQYGFLLVWVVIVGNAMAWLIQYLSAKLGLVTGRSLPEVLGDRIRHRYARYAYWVQAELVAMATDVAEVIGGAIALQLLFGVPLLAGGVITGVVSMVLLAIHNRRGSKPFERIVSTLVVVIAVGFCAGLVVGPPAAADVVGGLLPRFEDTGSVLLAASILGATVMPHAIYAHSALTRDRFGRVDEGADRATVLRATRIDVTIALVLAGTVNVVILLLAATNLQGVAGTDTLEGAHAALDAALGPVIATCFAVGLLASGLASTSVGAYAGAEIMHGLLRTRVPLLARRAVTLVPALALLALGVDPTLALVLSQVVLSFGIPFVLVPLVWLTAKRELLGSSVNRRGTTLAAAVAALLLIALNVTLLILLATGG